MITDIFGFSTSSKLSKLKLVKSILLYQVISFLIEYKFKLSKLVFFEIIAIK